MINHSSLNLPVIISKYGKRFVAYTPALDVSTSGKSLKDVKERFSELATIFIEEIIKAGTIDEVLSELGWTKGRQWTPPKIVSSQSIGVRIPVFA